MRVSQKGQTFKKRLGAPGDAGHPHSYTHTGHVFVIPTDQPANDTDPSGHLLFDLISAPEDLCTYNTQDNTIQHKQDTADIWFSTNIDPSGQIHDSVRAPRISPPAGSYHTTENKPVSAGPHPHGVKPVSGYLPSNTSCYQTLSTDTRSHGATPPPEHLSLGASHDLQMPHQSVTAI